MQVHTINYKVVNDHSLPKTRYLLTNIQEIPRWKRQLLAYEQHNKSRNKVSLPEKPWNETDNKY